MQTISKLKVHVIYECPNGCEPHGCSMIRLLQPLTHPSISDSVELTYSNKIPNHKVDIIIIERIWTHSLNTLELLESLDTIKSSGTKIIYQTDDDLLNVNGRPGDRQWPNRQQKNMILLLAREADGIIVSTSNLANVFQRFNNSVYIYENMLDEQLFKRMVKPALCDKIKFCYVVTFTHLEDLEFASAAIKNILHKYQNRIEFEVVGIGDENIIQDMFGSFPVTIKRVPNASVRYERFCSWMSENLMWDFGIAPLTDSLFSRSKSDIKFLDYSIIGIPGIYSNVPAYANTVIHGNNGLLSHNSTAEWTSNLDAMVRSEPLRRSLSNSAFEYVQTHRILKHKAVDLLKIIRTVVQKIEAPGHL